MVHNSVLAAFQERNKEGDIMGVVRTMYPDIEIILQSKTKNKRKKKND